MGKWLLAILLLAAATGGCNRHAADDAAAPNDSANTKDRVAVVDVNQVAQNLGWTDQINGKVDALKKSLYGQVDQAARSYDATIQKVKSGFTADAAATLSPDRQKSLEEMSAAAQLIVDQLHASADAECGKYRVKNVSQYRDALYSLIGEVAQSRKITVVLDSNEAVVYHDPTVDLTAAVTVATKANMPTITPVPVPTLPPAPALTMPNSPQSAPATAP